MKFQSLEILIEKNKYTNNKHYRTNPLYTYKKILKRIKIIYLSTKYIKRMTYKVKYKFINHNW